MRGINGRKQTNWIVVTYKIKSYIKSDKEHKDSIVFIK